METIKAEGLQDGYGKDKVLKGLSLQVDEGEILGILGDNGAGKSTLLSILATLREAENGKIYYFGQDKENYSLQNLRKNIGYVPQEVALYSGESPYQNLETFARLHGLRGKELKNRVLRILESLELTKEMNKPLSSLSGGMKRRTNFGVALIHQPKLLILDEPTVGIDFLSRKTILDALKDLAQKGHTIIYSTHALEEVQYACNRALIIEQGIIGRQLSIKNREDGVLEKNSMEEVFKNWFVKKEEG